MLKPPRGSRNQTFFCDFLGLLVLLGCPGFLGFVCLFVLFVLFVCSVSFADELLVLTDKLSQLILETKLPPLSEADFSSAFVSRCEVVQQRR